MSTRSAIGYTTPTGSIRSVYCHFDGYIYDGVGEMLATEYQAAYRVAQLVEMGDISSLGRTPFTSTFYGRDRNEPFTETGKYDSLLEYNEAFSDDVDYMYLYTREGWLVKSKEGYYTRLDELLEVETEEMKALAND